eukprot:gene14043-15502_t
MPEDFHQNVSGAFHCLLKNISFDQFPCGSGNWRSENKWRCEAPDLLNPSKEPDARLESIQSLKDLADVPPFVNKPDWSENIPALRQLAIENPERINEKNIVTHFTKLRLVGMNIADVDEGLLKFINLEELTLSANKLAKINPRNIPKNLKLLELYGNNITEIKGLPKLLPSLVHFGAGLNRLNTISGVLQENSWINLMSLDLSANEITDLRVTLQSLKLLPKLSNLLLKGNPLSLSSGYRGLVVDTLKQLKALDDQQISADEKHKFKGTSKLKGLCVDEAIVDISFSSLNGIRPGAEFENDNGEEFPRTDYRYQVVYNFLQNSTVKKRKVSEEHKIVDKDVNECAADFEDRTSCSDSDGDSSLRTESPVAQHDYLRLRKTKEKNFTEEPIELDYETVLMTSDLVNLKRFLSKGITLKLVENKVIVSPDPPSMQEDNLSVFAEGDTDGKSNKAGKIKAIQKDKQKHIPPPVKPSTSKDTKSKGKKGNKGEDVDVFELSRESKDIAEACLSLEAFTSGSKSFEADITLKRIESIEKEAASEDVKEAKPTPNKQPSNTDSKKRARDRKNSVNTSSTPLNRNKSPTSTRKARGKENKCLVEITETEQLQSCFSGITVRVKLNLRSWKTAKEVQDWINDNI